MSLYKKFKLIQHILTPQKKFHTCASQQSQRRYFGSQQQEASTDTALALYSETDLMSHRIVALDIQQVLNTMENRVRHQCSLCQYTDTVSQFPTLGKNAHVRELGFPETLLRRAATSGHLFTRGISCNRARVCQPCRSEEYSDMRSAHGSSLFKALVWLAMKRALSSARHGIRASQYLSFPQQPRSQTTKPLIHQNVPPNFFNVHPLTHFRRLHTRPSRPLSPHNVNNSMQSVDSSRQRHSSPIVRTLQLHPPHPYPPISF